LVYSFLRTTSIANRAIEFFKLNGRIPWNDIADNTSHHLSKRSCPDTDHKLMDPSHMKAKGVDDWLKHWLKLQNRRKRPLTFKNPSDSLPNPPARPRKASKGKGKKRAEVDDSSSEDSDKHSDDAAQEEMKRKTALGNHRAVQDKSHPSKTGAPRNAKAGGSGVIPDQPVDDADTDTVSNASGVPFAPCSAAKSRETRHVFLESLSDDKQYRQLIRVLIVAQVCAFNLSHNLYTSTNLITG
jgi:hypothetical protein